MKEFDKIFLSWHSGLKPSRHLLGVLQQEDTAAFTFHYDRMEVERLGKIYTELPNVDVVYNGSILEVFAKRLINSDRSDVQDFYDFWEIEADKVTDKFYLLAHTQGLLPTDNFEFLADFNPIPGLHFLTDLANLSGTKLPKDAVRIGDELTFEKDDSNAFDSKAVKVFKSGKQIGFIKKGHSHLFCKPGAEKLKLSVKAIDQNGTIKRIFVKVSLPA